jgi:predicted metal-dependent phosphotriesterase family hydrolase
MVTPATNEMLKAAMRKAIETGLIPSYSHLDGYLRSWESLALVVQAAVDAAPITDPLPTCSKRYCRKLPFFQ